MAHSDERAAGFGKGRGQAERSLVVKLSDLEAINALPRDIACGVAVVIKASVDLVALAMQL